MYKVVLAVDAKKHPKFKCEYHIWYAVFNSEAKLQKFGRYSKDQLIENIFADIRRWGSSSWFALNCHSDQLRPIELIDFLSMENFSNSHFGNLPYISQFDQSLKMAAERIPGILPSHEMQMVA